MLFLCAQTFQDLAYRLWIPASHRVQDDLLIYSLPIDQVRAFLVLFSILLLIVPFLVIGLRYYRAAPLASILGVIFGVMFIGLEVFQRSLDIFVVGKIWAKQFAASPADHAGLLQRFTVWNEIVKGWYFPLLLSYLLASCAFAVVTWTDRSRGRWYYLAPVAFILNVLRLSGRLLSSFADVSWLAGLNNELYFPAVFLINALLVIWFYVLARDTARIGRET